jgi:hypothetical protein
MGQSTADKDCMTDWIMEYRSLDLPNPWHTMARHHAAVI